MFWLDTLDVYKLNRINPWVQMGFRINLYPPDFDDLDDEALGTALGEIAEPAEDLAVESWKVINRKKVNFKFINLLNSHEKYVAIKCWGNSSSLGCQNPSFFPRLICQGLKNHLGTTKGPLGRRLGCQWTASSHSSGSGGELLVKNWKRCEIGMVYETESHVSNPFMIFSVVIVLGSSGQLMFFKQVWRDGRWQVWFLLGRGQSWAATRTFRIFWNM